MRRTCSSATRPANTDRLLDFTTAVTGSQYYAPPGDFDDPPPGGSAAAPAEPTLGRDDHLSGRADGELRPERRIRHRIAAPTTTEPTNAHTPPRRQIMNNLHRELALISAAAWEEIETEASRPQRNVAGRRVVDVVGPLPLDAASVGTGCTAQDRLAQRRYP